MNVKPKPLVLIDGSNMWYRAYTATMLDPPGGPVLICSSMLRKVCESWGKENIIICWDAGDGGRKALDAEYKAKRTHVSGVWEHLKSMKRMVGFLGISTAETPGFEADDTIGSLANQTTRDVLICSYDKDFYQLVDGRVKVLRPARKIHGTQYPDTTIDVPEVVEEFGCLPTRVALHKAFRGDASDNIPKLKIRFVKKFRQQYYAALSQSNSVEEFYQHLDCFDDKHHAELTSFTDRAKISYQIAQINIGLTPVVVDSKLSEDDVRAMCEQVNIKSIKLEDWVLLSDPEYQEELANKPKQGSLFG